jgi:hypothetical protein
MPWSTLNTHHVGVTTTSTYINQTVGFCVGNPHYTLVSMIILVTVFMLGNCQWNVNPCGESFTIESSLRSKGARHTAHAESIGSRQFWNHCHRRKCLTSDSGERLSLHAHISKFKESSLKLRWHTLGKLTYDHKIAIVINIIPAEISSVLIIFRAWNPS